MHLYSHTVQLYTLQYTKCRQKLHARLFYRENFQMYRRQMQMLSVCNNTVVTYCCYWIFSFFDYVRDSNPIKL